MLISGFLGGVGGAIVSQSISLNFSGSTIAGQGFIAMAAMIGKWNPIGVMGAAIFFGFAQSLGVIGSRNGHPEYPFRLSPDCTLRHHDHCACRVLSVNQEARPLMVRLTSNQSNL